MNTFNMISSAAGAGSFLFFGLLVALAPGDRRVGQWLIIASFVTALWFALIAVAGTAAPQGEDFRVLGGLLEIARGTFWILALVQILKHLVIERYRRWLEIFMNAFAAVLVFFAVSLTFPERLPAFLGVDVQSTQKLNLTLFLSMSLVGLFFTEQLFRHTARGSRWALKHLCLGLGFIFTFDFYLYADAVLFNRIAEVTWSARGLVNTLTIPMLVISASRHKEWDLKIFISRRVVFHSTGLIAAGAYLIAMATAGFYLRLFGGQWGPALQAAFLAAALLLLASLFASTHLRSRLRMFIARHFYRNKYEYGEQWLKFTHALSSSDLRPDSLNLTVLTAVCDMVESPAGVLFRRLDSGDFEIASAIEVETIEPRSIEGDSAFILALEEAKGAWDIRAAAKFDPQILELLPPAWISQREARSLIVPIARGADLQGFLLLAPPPGNRPIDWEDRNLLRTAGNQAASYLALLHVTDALAEARQFETFNRLSAFLVHDLKNVVAQLSLVLRNAEKHRANPEFVADAFTTVGNAVEKMNRMLSSLRQVDMMGLDSREFDLVVLLQEAIADKSDEKPRPELSITSSGEQIFLTGNRERLLAVVEHLLQNAIEATDSDGSVALLLDREEQGVRIQVKDTGSGMSEEFVKERLFKPFDTTKGKAGMGIGAYESRQVVTAMGGRLSVSSQPGMGTSFTIFLPAGTTRAV